MYMMNTSLLYLSMNGEEGTLLIDRLGAVDISIKKLRSVEQAETELLTGAHSIFLVRTETTSEVVFDLLQLVIKNNLSTRVLVSAKQGSIEDAVRLIRAGACDFVISQDLGPQIIESILRCTGREGPSGPRGKADPFEEVTESDVVLVGQSPAICEIRSAVNLVAKSQTTVLITGESGTGKDIVANLLHKQSNRSNNLFVALNCAALPKDVIENELFGHEKGAFTGALGKKEGCFEQANSGTLFFDEIAEMSLDTQAKLLRAIETQKFRRLGGKEEICVDVRTIAATNKNISRALSNKELREDLYYRLSVIEIYIPPLRERKEDIGLLVDYFLTVFSKKNGKAKQRFTGEALEMMNAYDWPGNVREVRNVVERALVICPNEFIGPQYLSERLQHQVSSQVHINIPLGSSTHEAERILILRTLASAGNNKAKTAKILGMSRKTLHNKLLSFSRM
jgi:DNA-binding NtrC family response regulator